LVTLLFSDSLIGFDICWDLQVLEFQVCLQCDEPAAYYPCQSWWLISDSFWCPCPLSLALDCLARKGLWYLLCIFAGSCWYVNQFVLTSDSFVVFWCEGLHNTLFAI
jgi:hypothetical protein